MNYDNKIEKIGWSSAEFITSNRVLPITGITGASWSSKRDVQPVYGAGSEPIGFGSGKKEYEASVTLLMEEVLAIMDVAPDGDLTSVPPFDFIIQLRPKGSMQVKTLTLKNCMFKENKGSMKSGDASVEIEIPMLCSGIKYT